MESPKTKLEQKHICEILHLYGFNEEIVSKKEYISKFFVDAQAIFIKYIVGVILKNGQHVVVKILREEKDLNHEFNKIEKQSVFSEILRSNGIKTPKRYKANGKYVAVESINGEKCVTTVEDWCGEEITEINVNIAKKIGKLMAKIHTISLNSGFEIGNKTLFCAAFENDVNAYSDFCAICKDENLNQKVVSEIKKAYDAKFKRIRSLWEKLPKAATQGDFSINNLTMRENGLAVFDYNNAGDEVLISDLILQGLLVAYEMDLPSDTPESYSNELFLSLLNGYLSVRKLIDLEKDVAWDIYSMYQSLWFTKIKIRNNSLIKLVSDKKYNEANRLLSKMLTDITAKDDGRFQSNAQCNNLLNLNKMPCSICDFQID